MVKSFQYIISDKLEVRVPYILVHFNEIHKREKKHAKCEWNKDSERGNHISSHNWTRPSDYHPDLWKQDDIYNCLIIIVMNEGFKVQTNAYCCQALELGKATTSKFPTARIN